MYENIKMYEANQPVPIRLSIKSLELILVNYQFSSDHQDMIQRALTLLQESENYYEESFNSLANKYSELKEFVTVSNMPNSIINEQLDKYQHFILAHKVIPVQK